MTDKKIGAFDFVNAVSHTKENLLEQEGVAESAYVPFLTNRALSYHLDTIMYANDMNRYPNLDNKLQFDYLISSVRPKKRFSKWAKPIDSDALQLIQKAFGYNSTLAAQTLALLSQADLKVIEERQDVGGISGKRTR